MEKNSHGESLRECLGWAQTNKKRLQRRSFFLFVPGAGIEPAWPQGPGDFESPASTNFTTPAAILNNIRKKQLQSQAF